MDRFLSIEAFVRVAQAQSFAEAARQLRLSKSVVTTRVQQLEELLGGPLFHRTTRAVRLSEMGQAFFRDCHELVNRTNEVVDQMREVGGTPAGLLRVHALTGFVLGHLAQLLAEFQERYPQIHLDLFVSDAVIDPVKQGFDVALQIFPPSSEELVSRRLFPVRRIFCASPDYLKRRGTPKHPRDLFGHRLGLYSGYPTRDRWVFHRDGDEPVMLDLKPTLMSNSVHLLREYGCEHAGIVCLPTLVASEWIAKGQLKVILADFQLSSFWLSAVYPRTQRGAFKLRLFIESLAASFAGGEPPWDKVLIDRGVMLPGLIED
ncbi:LysR family transcriptional regulator [Piscinibacter sp. XHJ-5]|uniref:LysR family transcriptional regulator n=1 Tax=Piscinibacter sp. XHJ-5 TaxID=3037797 RepID=UPI00245331C0|nr:LysR family transcriptional regulator [Piscinibacter sp. XHJ-5]